MTKEVFVNVSSIPLYTDSLQLYEVKIPVGNRTYHFGDPAFSAS